MPRPPAQKVVILPLFQNVTLQTDRTLSYSTVSVDLPAAESWGPYLASIRALTLTRNRTANFQWKTVLQWSLDGVSFSNAVDLSAAVVANGQLIHPAVTSTDNFCAPVLRFGGASANQSGSALEQAICSAWLVFVFQT